MSKINVVKINDLKTREKAIEVVNMVYLKEKKWVKSVEKEIAPEIDDTVRYSWFLATVNQKPAGVLRLWYDPPLDFPPELKVTLRDDIDFTKMRENARFVEIGRFMILPEYRRNIRIAIRLMQMAIKEVVERDYTHFLTDVFEGDPHSPLKFHTRILGFEIIGTHLHGELNCSLTRIILTLDILKAYKRIKERRNKIYRMLSAGVRSVLDKKLATVAD